MFNAMTPYKISSKCTNQFKICAQLKNLNVRNFEMVEATTLSSMESRSTSVSSPYKFHPNPAIRSEVALTSAVLTSTTLECLELLG
jgi:hypothetical protein